MATTKGYAMTNDEGAVRQLYLSETTRDMISEQITVEQWLAIRKEAGLSA